MASGLKTIGQTPGGSDIDPDWDAIVIGAGPAGAVTARQLAAAGRKTLLVDRQIFPRGKVCGGYLNGQALSVLSSAGLDEALAEARPAPLHRFVLLAGRRRADLDLPSGVSIHRADFDAALARAAVKAGALFLPETRATVDGQLDPADGFRRVQLARGGGPAETVRARVVVAADGLGHPSLSRLDQFACQASANSRVGVGITLADDSAEYGPGVIYMAVAREGYVGLVRTADGGLTLAAAFDAATLRQAGGPAQAVRAVLGQVGLPSPASLTDDGWRGTPALTRSSAALAAARIYLVGDAAAYVEPFTGEGMAWAVTSATSAARSILATAEGWDERLARDWQLAQTRRIERGGLACRVLAAALRRPLVVGAAVRVLSRLPILARPFVRRISAQSYNMKAVGHDA